MQHLPEVGPWAKEKLDALARYLEFYTTVLKRQPWRTIYLDAYAGGGRALVRTKERGEGGGPDLFGTESDDAEVRQLIDGSPRVALGITNPFDRYVFVDPDPGRVAELEALQEDFVGTRAIVVLKSAAAEGIDWITAQPLARKTHRGVAFLDPFGAGLEWTTIQKLADTRLFEVVVNFALDMAIVRMLVNTGEVPDRWAAKLDGYFGDHQWFDEVYQQREGGLFSVPGIQKRPDYRDRLLELYRDKLRAAFGHVSTPRLIRNTRGTPLYYLLWAGPHKKGLEGADYILKMGERLGRARSRQPVE